MNNAKVIAGVLIFLAALALGAVYEFVFKDGPPSAEFSGEAVTVKVFYGSEKKSFLHDPDVRRILEKDYGVIVNGVKMGSLETIEAVRQTPADGIWPSSELAALAFEAEHQGVRKKLNVFSTPLVLYSWPEVTRALLDEGIVREEQRGGGAVYYVADMPGLLDLIRRGKPWKDLGLERQHGPVSLSTTDPTKSNSGFLAAGLMAILLNGGDMVTAQSLPGVLPDLKDIFANSGFMENSTGILFDKYLRQGRGMFPLICAYESLVIEFYRNNPDMRDTLRDQVRVLIPEPTTWSEHPYLALTADGERLIGALQDQRLMAIAWERYGFRTGSLGIGSGEEVLRDLGLSERIDSVTPLPAPGVMFRILNQL